MLKCLKPYLPADIAKYQHAEFEQDDSATFKAV